MKVPASLFLALLIASPVFATEQPLKTSVAELWLDHCARCHGDTGNGNTTLGQKLKVTNYKSSNAQKAFSDDYLKQLILDGSARDGLPVMPSFKNELTETEVNALVQYIRSLSK